MADEQPDISAMTPAEAGAELDRMARELHGPGPLENPTTPIQASAKLAALENDPAWRDKFLSGDLAAARQREALQKMIGDEQLQPPGFIEVVDAVSNRFNVSWERYEELHNGAREFNWLPETGEQYVRDLDSGARVDRPTQGDFAAAQQAMARKLQDETFRQGVEKGSVEDRLTFYELNRVLSTANSDDGQPISSNFEEYLRRRGLR